MKNTHTNKKQRKPKITTTQIEYLRTLKQTTAKKHITKNTLPPIIMEVENGSLQY